MRDYRQSHCIIFFSILFSWGIIAPLFSQEEQLMRCGSDQIHQVLLQNDRDYKSKYRNFQEQYRQNVQGRSSDKSRQSAIYTIPVVVHIIHAGSPLGSDANPTDEEVAQIVSEASQRFRHMHGGAATYSNPFYGIDTEIELCLAAKDEDGNYTSGVTRHYDPNNAIGDYGVIAPALNNHAWDKSKYCNLYIVTQLTNASGVYMGGYDFTIYDSPAFWSGLIAHELGHYFNLRHTFQGGCPNGNCLTNGDEVCDTPPKATSGFGSGTCASPSNSCTTDDDDLSTNNPYRPAGMGDQPDMFANYMDYTGSCWDSFTEGQKTRMRTDIEMYRVALKDNAAACSGSPPALDAGVTTVNTNQSDVCQASFTPTVTIKNYGENTLSTLQIKVDIDGSLSHTTNWSGTLASGASATVPLSGAIVIGIGEPVLRFYTDQPNGSSDANLYNNSIYQSVQYLGGTSCQSLSGCANFNANADSGPGNNTVVTLTASFPSSSHDVQICVTTQGDVSWSQEVFDVIDESGTNRGRTNFSVDCGAPTPAFCFIASLSEYQNWISNGSITVTLSPISTEINPDLCGVNQACVTINIPQGGSCPSVNTLSGTITSGLYQASNFVQADGTIFGSSNVIVGGANYSTLNIGFEIKLGGTLEVQTTGCN